MPPNIEKAKFRPGEYVGYCAGNVWNIKRCNGHNGREGDWLATTPKPPYCLSGQSLADVGAKLEKLEAEIYAKPVWTAARKKKFKEITAEFFNCIVPSQVDVDVTRDDQISWTIKAKHGNIVDTGSLEAMLLRLKAEHFVGPKTQVIWMGNERLTFFVTVA